MVDKRSTFSCAFDVRHSYTASCT